MSTLYQSTKIVSASPMALGKYNDLRGWELPENEDPDTEGYIIEYMGWGEPNHPDFENYITWSPKDVFEFNHILPEEAATKSLNNTDQSGCRDNVPDVDIFGEDLFKLLSKASSAAEGWMKSTKAMETQNGCVIQVTTQQGDNIAEALTFVPDVYIKEKFDVDGKVIGRSLF